MCIKGSYKCHLAVEKHLDGYAAEHPGGYLLAFLDGDDVVPAFFKSYAQAEKAWDKLEQKFKDESIILPLAEAGAYIL